MFSRVATRITKIARAFRGIKPMTLNRMFTSQVCRRATSFGLPKTLGFMGSANLAIKYATEEDKNFILCGNALNRIDNLTRNYQCSDKNGLVEEDFNDVVKKEFYEYFINNPNKALNVEEFIDLMFDIIKKIDPERGYPDMIEKGAIFMSEEFGMDLALIVDPVLWNAREMTKYVSWVAKELGDESFGKCVEKDMRVIYYIAIHTKQEENKLKEEIIDTLRFL